MQFKAVCFDLDGTLLDSLNDLAECTNKILKNHGFPIHDLDKFRYFVGDGVRSLIIRALPEKVRKKKLVDECVNDFEEIYRKNCFANTLPYKDIHELLIELKKINIKLTILSNKPHEFTLLTVRKFFKNPKFDVVLGYQEEIKKKPDPAGVFEISEVLQLHPKRFIFLGDTGTDMKTAVSAGCYPVGVLWGFRTEKELRDNGARAIIKKPLEVLEILS